MTKKLRLLILDANVVIKLFELDLWDVVVEACEIYLAESIVEGEAHFSMDAAGEKEYFDLQSYVADGRVKQFAVPSSDIGDFRSQFDPGYFERLDLGEAESLTFLVGQSERYLICSADAIVYRTLGNLNRLDQGISLEMLLRRIGRTASLPRAYSEAWCKEQIRKGFADRLQGRGSKAEPF